MRVNFKIPKMKFGKIKMNTVENLDKINIDFNKVKNAENKKEKGPYEHTNYKTVKEFFNRSVELYPDKSCILEKPDHKTPYKVTTYREFSEDANALGTALIKILNQKNKRVIIIGETQYGWYVSYIAMLLGVGIAVPVDRELPDNELENVVKRAKATCIIYSQKKEESIKKIQDLIDNENLKKNRITRINYNKILGPLHKEKDNLLKKMDLNQKAKRQIWLKESTVNLIKFGQYFNLMDDEQFFRQRKKIIKKFADIEKESDIIDGIQTERINKTNLGKGIKKNNQIIKQIVENNFDFYKNVSKKFECK